MIDQNFCDFIEYKICDFFLFSDNELVKGFWCDGVNLRDDKYSTKFINDNKKVTGAAFVGKTGQDEYELIINFGRKSLSRLARGLDIKDCLPDNENSDWLTVDVANKKLSIQLQ